MQNQHGGPEQIAKCVLDHLLVLCPGHCHFLLALHCLHVAGLAQAPKELDQALFLPSLKGGTRRKCDEIYAGGGWRCRLADGAHQDADSIVRSTTLLSPSALCSSDLTLHNNKPENLHQGLFVSRSQGLLQIVVIMMLSPVGDWRPYSGHSLSSMHCRICVRQSCCHAVRCRGGYWRMFRD